MKYICDCGKMADIKKVQQGRGIWELTEVNDDEVCKYCGHYAMAFREVTINKRGRISPQLELDNLYHPAVQDRKRKLLENGDHYWENQSLQDILKWWTVGKTFDEKNEEWLNERKNLHKN